MKYPNRERSCTDAEQLPMVADSRKRVVRFIARVRLSHGSGAAGLAVLLLAGWSAAVAQSAGQETQAPGIAASMDRPGLGRDGKAAESELPDAPRPVLLQAGSDPRNSENGGSFTTARGADWGDCRTACIRLCRLERFDG